MKVNCGKLCGTCDVQLQNNEKCEDLNTKCKYWSDNNYCVGRYKDYMESVCKSSCNICKK